MLYFLPKVLLQSIYLRLSLSKYEIFNYSHFVLFHLTAQALSAHTSTAVNAVVHPSMSLLLRHI